MRCWILLLRMLVCVLFSVDIWHQGLLALSWYRYLGDEPNHRTGRWEGDHTAHSWIAFGVILGVVSPFPFPFPSLLFSKLI